MGDKSPECSGFDFSTRLAIPGLAIHRPPGYNAVRMESTSDNVTILEQPGRTIYIVGTAHVSQDSVEEVRRVIDEVQPDIVAIELDEARHRALTDENRWRNLDVFEVIRQGKTLFLLANLAIGAYQRRLGAQLGVKPGAEMLAAAEKAEEIGATLALVDRDIHITLKRTWASVGFFRKAELLSAIVAGLVSREEIEEVDIEKLKEKAQLSEMMAEFARMLPEVHKPLIDERDQYLISKTEELKGEKIVVVVGAGHVEGMVRYAGTKIDRSALDELPKKASWMGALKWIIPSLILAAFSFGYYKHSGRTVENMITAWVLPNSIFAAVMTAMALAKPLSILTAFVASPITSLNPLLPAGVVVGLMEAWLRKPTVQDCEDISDDVQSLKGVYKNQFTRVLLVAFMATMGSAMGAWIGLGWLFAIVGGSG
ncbi:MAG: pheromone shutdown-related protein TraB [Myxococcota bacterium]|jgi:pheromone shutdown-related protein TraB